MKLSSRELSRDKEIDSDYLIPTSSLSFFSNNNLSKINNKINKKKKKNSNMKNFSSSSRLSSISSTTTTISSTTFPSTSSLTSSTNSNQNTASISTSTSLSNSSTTSSNIIIKNDYLELTLLDDELEIYLLSLEDIPKCSWWLIREFSNKKIKNHSNSFHMLLMEENGLNLICPKNSLIILKKLLIKSISNTSQGANGSTVAPSSQINLFSPQSSTSSAVTTSSSPSGTINSSTVYQPNDKIITYRAILLSFKGFNTEISCLTYRILELLLDNNHHVYHVSTFEKEIFLIRNDENNENNIENIKNLIHDFLSNYFIEHSNQLEHHIYHSHQTNSPLRTISSGSISFVTPHPPSTTSHIISSANLSARSLSTSNNSLSRFSSSNSLRYDEIKSRSRSSTLNNDQHISPYFFYDYEKEKEKELNENIMTSINLINNFNDEVADENLLSENEVYIQQDILINNREIVDEFNKEKEINEEDDDENPFDLSWIKEDVENNDNFSTYSGQSSSAGPATNSSFLKKNNLMILNESVYLIRGKVDQESQWNQITSKLINLLLYNKKYSPLENQYLEGLSQSVDSPSAPFSSTSYYASCSAGFTESVGGIDLNDEIINKSRSSSISSTSYSVTSNIVPNYVDTELISNQSQQIYSSPFISNNPMNIREQYKEENYQNINDSNDKNDDNDNIKTFKKNHHFLWGFWYYNDELTVIIGEEDLDQLPSDLIIKSPQIWRIIKSKNAKSKDELLYSLNNKNNDDNIENKMENKKINHLFSSFFDLKNKQEIDFPSLSITTPLTSCFLIPEELLYEKIC